MKIRSLDKIFVHLPKRNWKNISQVGIWLVLVLFLLVPASGFGGSDGTFSKQLETIQKNMNILRVQYDQNLGDYEDAKRDVFGIGGLTMDQSVQKLLNRYHEFEKINCAFLKSADRVPEYTCVIKYRDPYSDHNSDTTIITFFYVIFASDHDLAFASKIVKAVTIID